MTKKRALETTKPDSAEDLYVPGALSAFLAGRAVGASDDGDAAMKKMGRKREKRGKRDTDSSFDAMTPANSANADDALFTKRSRVTVRATNPSQVTQRRETMTSSRENENRDDDDESQTTKTANRPIAAAIGGDGEIATGGKKKKKAKRNREMMLDGETGKVKRAAQFNDVESREEKAANAGDVRQGEDEAGDENRAGRQKQRANRKMAPDHESHAGKMSADEKARTVFVGNVSLDATKRNVRKLFAEFTAGRVESVRVRSLIASNAKVSKKVAAVSHKLSPVQQSLHFYVKFQQKVDAEKALALNGHSFMDRTLRVDRCSGRRNYDSQTTVFVGGCPFAVQEDELRGHFEAKTGSGSVDFVRVVRDPVTGKSLIQGRGIAFVAFKEIPSAVLALQLDGSTLNKREIRVSKIMKKKQRFLAGGISRPNHRRTDAALEQRHHRGHKNSFKQGTITSSKQRFDSRKKPRSKSIPMRDSTIAKGMPKALRKAIKKKQKKHSKTSLMTS